MSSAEFIIWSSSPDTSQAGIAKFCKLNAGRYNKTPEEMAQLSLAKLISFMWNDIQSWRLTAYAALDVPAAMPILVIADRTGEEPLSKPEMSCFVMNGASLNQIFDVREGISTTFYSDGNNIRCRDIGENGADHYLFREITTLKGLKDFASRVEKGEIFTESELDQFSQSLAPRIHKIYGWPEPQKQPLEVTIAQANTRIPSQQTHHEKQVELIK